MASSEFLQKFHMLGDEMLTVLKMKRSRRSLQSTEKRIDEKTESRGSQIFSKLGTRIITAFLELRNRLKIIRRTAKK